jgi:hypothetical protein
MYEYGSLRGASLNRDDRPAHFDYPSRYRICVEGRLSSSWSDRLGDLAITVHSAKGRQPVTTLTGEVLDQTALMGVLSALYDMGFPLLELQRLEPLPTAADASR